MYSEFQIGSKPVARVDVWASNAIRYFFRHFNIIACKLYFSILHKKVHFCKSQEKTHEATYSILSSRLFIVIHGSVFFQESRKTKIDDTKPFRIARYLGFMNTNELHKTKMDQKHERTKTISKD